MAKPPFNDLRFAPALVEVEQRSDGSTWLVSPHRLPEPPRAVGVWLERHAVERPEDIFLAERGPDGGWARWSYVEILRSVRAVGQALLDRGLGPERPAAVLSDNSVAHAILSLACQHVGVPIVPISPAYSLMSGDFEKLRQILGLARPGLVLVEDSDLFTPALAAAGVPAEETVAVRNPPAGAMVFADLLGTAPTGAVDDAFAAVGPDTVAKILFTSGSTGAPKGVINTQRMLTANQEQIAVLWPFVEARPPVVVDWLPWSHTFGANHNTNLVLRNGGTLHIDAGKPAPGRFEQTVANLKEVSPTLYFNVPRGYDMLVQALERDDGLRASFFADLDMIFYAAAALPPHLWGKLEDLAVAARGHRVRFLSAWGATETAPMATAVHYTIEEAGVIGLPAPGTEVKLVASGDKTEIRVRGPNVTPGYWRAPDVTAAAFDEDGFYRVGDAVRFVDPADPTRGLAFDGRVAEDFKLSSGTWVHVGKLRVDLVAACAPVMQDCVIAGHDRDEIGILVFPNLAACRALCPDLAADAAVETVLARAEVRAALAEGLRRHNAAQPANSTTVAHALLLAAPPSIDGGEITDKGYVNQRAVLEARGDRVAALFEPADGTVVTP